MSRRSIKTWYKMTGTLLGSDAANGTAYVLGWIDGNMTGTFAIADIKILRLNSALVNVIRTNASDVNVTNTGGSVRYAQGADYEVVNAPQKNQAKSVDLVAAYEQGNTFQLRRLAGGKITPGQRVRVSLDVLGGFVGQIGDGSHCNSFAEPLWYSEMSKVVNFTMNALGVKKMFFGFDEMHGFNRDSRSRRLGRSNAETLAHAMNSLQQMMSAVDADARAMVWADMITPFHNGGA